MKKNSFPFGAKFGWDQFEDIQQEWKYYFNYGYCTNEMKWAATEKVKGIRDYTKGRLFNLKDKKAAKRGPYSHL